MKPTRAGRRGLVLALSIVGLAPHAPAPRTLGWVPLAPAAFLCPASAAAETKRPGLAENTLWDDGRAEFSQYEGTTQRYGEARPTRARIVIVKEDLLRDVMVKSEQGPVPGKTVEVLKVVFTAEFTTGSYFYRQFATTFLDRRSLEALKESATHFDGCGITSVRVGPKHGRTVHEAHSYWEGEADREVELAWPAGAFPRVHSDALPLWLREQMARRTASQVFLLPSQVGGRSPIEATRPVVASIHWSDAGTIAVPAGSFPAKRAEVGMPGGTDRFWFDARFPHVLLKMETAAGRVLALRKTQRLDYWNHHALGDEKLVE